MPFNSSVNFFRKFVRLFKKAEIGIVLFSEYSFYEFFEAHGVCVRRMFFILYGSCKGMRFEKQELFKEIGKKGQLLIEKATIAIVGCGALGSVSAELLVRAGVKKITLIDRDLVELSNLQRQSLYTEEDVGKLKASALAGHIKKINSSLEVKAFSVDLDVENVSLLDADVVVDGTDNFYTRFVVNEYCKKENIPWVFGSAVGSSGFVFTVRSNGPCLRCLFDEPSVVLGSCDTEGVLNTIVHVIAALQVTEVLKILTRQKPSGDLLFFNVWNPSLLKIKIEKKTSCQVCSGRFGLLSGKSSSRVVKMCGSNLFQVKGKKVDLKVLKRKLEKISAVKLGEQCLFFKGLVIFSDGRVLVRASSENGAKSLCARYLE